jgi:exodeoxyribonuclease V alpha subunit
MIQSEQPLTRLDQALARFMVQRSRLDDGEKARFAEIVAELSSQLSQGHSCIRVDDRAKALVLASGLASERGSAPLVTEGDRLYLHRYWQYEKRLAARICAVAGSQKPPQAELEPMLDRYFPPKPGETDWQRNAAKGAVSQGFSIITGGPGTGKTTTVVKILALLLEQSDRPLQIALAAPTGKAAMRLQESIGQSKAGLPCSEAIRERIPEEASTIHRLLGAMPPSPYFRHDANHPLPHDLIVIDEASMIDLALMAKLVDALKENARLILLGDKDQLASVESGAVLADLTLALPERTLELKKSWRFDENIKALADAVNRQRSDDAWNILQSAATANLGLLETDLIEAIAGRQVEYLRLIRSGADYDAVNQAFNRFQTLCSNRHGPRGVQGINSAVEQRLGGEGMIMLGGQWYPGRPVMITQNDPAMHLYNGDIGICMADPEQAGKLMVFFPRPDGGVKKYLPSRLPHCEAVFAMTIHKSQGSEFDDVLIVLPDQHNPVLTKELLYTGITRARKTVTLAAEQGIFEESVGYKVERHGGLVQKVRQAKTGND